ncbi:MAG: hypothetical protein U0792_05370 [Gemmataceae bacterium]
MSTEIPNDAAEQTKKHGLVCQVDDLVIGETYAVLGRKRSQRGIPMSGESFRLKAIALPFIVCEMAWRPDNAPAFPITIDTRYVCLMKVSADYFQAQMSGASATGPEQQSQKIQEVGA